MRRQQNFDSDPKVAFHYNHVTFIAIKRVKLKIVETVYDLCQPSMFTATFSGEATFKFFLPLGNRLSLCNRKNESD